MTRSMPIMRRSEGPRSRAQGNAGDYWHWAKVASEVARIELRAEMDFEVVKAIADQETTGRRRTRAWCFAVSKLFSIFNSLLNLIGGRWFDPFQLQPNR